MSNSEKPWVVVCRFHRLYKEYPFDEKYKAEQLKSKDDVRAHPKGFGAVMRQQ